MHNIITKTHEIYRLTEYDACGYDIGGKRGRAVFWSEFGVCADVFKNSAREGRRHHAARRRRPAPMKTTDLRCIIRVSVKTALYII